MWRSKKWATLSGQFGRPSPAPLPELDAFLSTFKVRYSSRAIRAYLRRRGIRITIPHKENEHRSGPFDRAIYRLRERVERLINRLKQNRRNHDAL